MGQKKKVFTKDYTDGLLNEPELAQEDWEELIHRAEALQRLPHIVNPLAAARFDKAVKACDAIAKEFSGRIKAAVDFEIYEATIVLECAYIEFRHHEFMETLAALSLISQNIQITSTPSELFRIDISMPYFVPLPS